MPKLSAKKLFKLRNKEVNVSHLEPGIGRSSFAFIAFG